MRVIKGLDRYELPHFEHVIIVKLRDPLTKQVFNVHPISRLYLGLIKEKNGPYYYNHPEFFCYERQGDGAILELYPPPGQDLELSLKHARVEEWT